MCRTSPSSQTTSTSSTSSASPGRATIGARSSRSAGGVAVISRNRSIVAVATSCSSSLASIQVASMPHSSVVGVMAPLLPRPRSLTREMRDLAISPVGVAACPAGCTCRQRPPKPGRSPPREGPSVNDVVAPHGPRSGYRSALLCAAAAVVLTACQPLVDGALSHTLLAVAAVLAAAGAADARQRARHRRTENELAHLAFHDGLTGLANRALFTDRLEQGLRRLARSDRDVSVVYIDLDGFKNVNDTLGPAMGDH